MTTRPLRCTRCDEQASVVDDTRGVIDHGPALIDAEGVAYPDTAHPDANEYPQNQAVVSSTTRAVCTAPECGHEWRLRRRFVPTGGAL